MPSSCAPVQISNSAHPPISPPHTFTSRRSSPQEKYKADDEGKFPLYYIFGKGSTEPLCYTGAGKKANDLLAWLAQNTGAFFGLKVGRAVGACVKEWKPRAL